ncbi:arginine and glutamate-rich protein 1-like [Panicum miliaceum]|uniref:Arginine and glutamate-rich protein 1-like n=1 Tax=Panicum miliaceum TaxID=4540 RepID=A0A3L6S058_PANMI|nr:arginine and glutamate-rich protein 1-like [Panicum miliaceum]
MDDFFIDLNDAAQGVGVGVVSESSMSGFASKKIELFKETEGERKARLDEIVTLEKVKVEEAREHRKMMLDIERERLALDKQRLHMEAEKKEKEEDERILAINLDQCLPMQRMYYQALQEDIIQKLMSQHRGPTH